MDINLENLSLFKNKDLNFFQKEHNSVIYKYLYTLFQYNNGLIKSHDYFPMAHDSRPSEILSLQHNEAFLIKKGLWLLYGKDSMYDHDINIILLINNFITNFDFPLKRLINILQNIWNHQWNLNTHLHLNFQNNSNILYFIKQQNNNFEWNNILPDVIQHSYLWLYLKQWYGNEWLWNKIIELDLNIDNISLLLPETKWLKKYILDQNDIFHWTKQNNISPWTTYINSKKEVCTCSDSSIFL